MAPTPRNKSKRGVNRRATQNKTPNVQNQVMRFLDKPSYKNLPIVRLKVPAAPDVYSTTVTTGLITGFVTLDPTTRVNSWSSRFSSTFLEYRIRSVSLEVITLNSSVGVAAVYFTEINTGTPTYTEAQEQVSNFFQLSNSGQSKKILTWTPHTFVDMAWTSCGTGISAVYYSVYTDNPHFASSIVATPVIMIRPIFDIEFRGFYAP